MPDPHRRELLASAGLFLLTLGSVWLTYALFWGEDRPLGDAALARDAAAFAVSLMSILLAHELGHYTVARLHGFETSPPWFIPFPMGFGTFGAVIRLRSLPPSRSALLEMGAAGPIAGLVVAIGVLALGLPQTGPPPPLPPGAAGPVEVTILANPLAMDLLGVWLLGAPPGRFDTLSPTALAGWVGCLLTGVNLLPIGQLDGGHLLRALRPAAAPRVSQVLLVLALLGGWFWSGWLVWAALLWLLGASRPLPVPAQPGLSARALGVLAVAVLAFVLSFMPVPFQQDVLPVVPGAGAG